MNDAAHEGLLSCYIQLILTLRRLAASPRRRWLSGIPIGYWGVPHGRPSHHQWKCLLWYIVIFPLCRAVTTLVMFVTYTPHNDRTPLFYRWGGIYWRISFSPNQRYPRSAFLIVVSCCEIPLSRPRANKVSYFYFSVSYTFIMSSTMPLSYTRIGQTTLALSNQFSNALATKKALIKVIPGQIHNVLIMCRKVSAATTEAIGQHQQLRLQLQKRSPRAACGQTEAPRCARSARVWMQERCLLRRPSQH